MPDFNSMERKALARIHQAFEKHKDGLYIGHSGGKDSSVVYHLASKVLARPFVVHTTKELAHEDKSYPTVPYEDHTFLYELAQTQPILMAPLPAMPKVIEVFNLTCQIDGTRRDESERHNRSSTYFCNGQDLPRENMPDAIDNGLFGLSFVYPIFDWTTSEVWEYIRLNNIKVSDSYKR